MRGLLLASCALVSFAAVSSSASAEETTIIRRESSPSVTVERREGVVERREVTTGGVDCETKTIHKEDGMGNSKTIRKENCN